jgi:hypothetical protein
MTSFTLVIPTYKECENLKWLLPEIFKHFKGHRYDLVSSLRFASAVLAL